MDLIKSGSYIDMFYAKTCATTKIRTVVGYHVVLATLLLIQGFVSFLISHSLVHVIRTLTYDANIIEPRHDKTCLREFPTRPDTNWPAQPQKLARVLKFRL